MLQHLNLKLIIRAEKVDVIGILTVVTVDYM